MRRIGFVGVGSIGAPMARRVIGGGFEVTVCDRSPRARADFAASASRLTERPSDCADHDMVIVMVADDDQVKQVMQGEEGLLAAVNPQRPPLVAIMSTVLPQTVEAMAAAGAPKGVRLIDAPVSGLPVLAEQGKLTIMAGGEAADLEAMRPVLATMGQNIFHTGPLGSGEVTKLVNNMVGITNLFLAVEAMRVGKRYGMDLRKLTAIMETSSGRNFYTQDWDRGKASLAYFTRSPELIQVAVDLSRKDLRHAQELARQGNVSCPLLDRIVDSFRDFTYEEIEQGWVEVTEQQANPSQGAA